MRRTSYLALCAALFAGTAWAHTGVGPAAGFAYGLAHPFSGLDHVLAMILAGLLAAQIGGRAMWALPAACVGMMAAGGALGMAGAPLPLAELGIALSVLVLGGVLAFGWKPPIALAIAAVGVFAVFHGHSHGSEMRYGLPALSYGSGMVASTLALQAAGMALGTALRKNRHGALALRCAGGAAAAGGVLMLTMVA